jgi:hypothetical protein
VERDRRARYFVVKARAAVAFHQIIGFITFRKAVSFPQKETKDENIENIAGGGSMPFIYWLCRYA